MSGRPFRETDWYDEVVSGPDGEVVHEAHEPLSEAPRARRSASLHPRAEARDPPLDRVVEPCFVLCVARQVRPTHLARDATASVV